jgi:hypothetical protein
MNKWTFTCPECGGHNITIEARVYLRVIQSPETGDYTTSQIDSEPGYDTDDWATCDDCNNQSRLKDY